jgi:hypothetical protein
MTKASLKQSKADTVTPSEAVVTLSQAEIIKLSQSVGANYVASQSTREIMAAACKKLFQAKVKIGKRKATKTQTACIYIAAFLEARFPKGLNAKGEKVSEDILINTSGYFKRAVESGEPYNENATKAKGESKSIMIAFPKTASGAEAAGKLATLTNKMKEANSELADLAAYIIDALADAGFEPADVAADDAE